MAKKINLEGLREEIDSRQKAKGHAIKESGGSRDELLSGLVNSLNSGTPSNATQKIKMVENVSNSVEVAGVGVDGAGGFVSKKANSGVIVNNDVNHHNHHPVQDNVNEGMMPERENKYDAQVNDLVNKYKNGSPIQNNYVSNNNGMNGYLTEAQMIEMAQKNGGLNQVISNKSNGNVITEQVQGIVDGFLNEHFGSLVQEAMKNTIIEMYSLDRVKKTLEENKDLIRGVVVEVIKELQERNKNAKSKK